MWGQLMARLGYERYVAQGGDWGAMITQNMGMTETEHCAGIHITMPIVAPDPDTMSDLTPLEEAALDVHGLSIANQTRDTPSSSRPGPRPWAMPWPIPRWARWPGLSKNSTPGPIAHATASSTRSMYWTGMKCWIMS